MAFRALIAGLALFAGAMSANASLSTLEQQLRTGHADHDSMTGLTWLKLDETAGMSYEAVLAQTGSGGTFADFDIATLSAQLRTLTFDAGVDFSLDLGKSNHLRAARPDRRHGMRQCVAAGLGFRLSFRLAGSDFDAVRSATLPRPVPLPGEWSTTPLAVPSDGVAHLHGDQRHFLAHVVPGRWRDPKRWHHLSPMVGTWLVTNVAADSGAVPTYALLLVGLATVGVATRRRKARRA